MATAKDYRNDIRPNWCPGCGHYGVQAAITDAVVAKNIPPEKLAVISGIGCSSRIGGYFYAYGAHTTHGRALPYPSFRHRFCYKNNSSWCVRVPIVHL